MSLAFLMERASRASPALNFVKSSLMGTIHVQAALLVWLTNDSLKEYSSDLQNSELKMISFPTDYFPYL